MKKAVLWGVAGLTLSASGILLWAGESPVQNSAEPPKVIEISAKKYEFTPNQIHVPKGTKVELKVHSEDETHGVKLNLYAEGVKDKKSPGLVFDEAEQNGKVTKDQDQVLDFVAEQPGTYKFECAHICGFGHGKMKGELIVDP